MATPPPPPRESCKYKCKKVSRTKMWNKNSGIKCGGDSAKRSAEQKCGTKMWNKNEQNKNVGGPSDMWWGGGTTGGKCKNGEWNKKWAEQKWAWKGILRKKVNLTILCGTRWVWIIRPGLTSCISQDPRMSIQPKGILNKNLKKNHSGPECSLNR